MRVPIRLHAGVLLKIVDWRVEGKFASHGKCWLTSRRAADCGRCAAISLLFCCNYCGS